MYVNIIICKNCGAARLSPHLMLECGVHRQAEREDYVQPSPQPHEHEQEP